MGASRAWAAALPVAAAALLLCCCCGVARGQATAPLIAGQSGGWRQGRATFYGGPVRFLQNFPDRGPPPEYGFGSAVYGSCGYTQQVRCRIPSFTCNQRAVSMRVAVIIVVMCS
jgi:hypothetical protein